MVSHLEWPALPLHWLWLIWTCYVGRLILLLRQLTTSWSLLMQSWTLMTMLPLGRKRYLPCVTQHRKIPERYITACRFLYSLSLVVCVFLYLYLCIFFSFTPSFGGWLDLPLEGCYSFCCSENGNWRYLWVYL